MGERFKESVYINSGLLALGNVISALADSKKKVLEITLYLNKHNPDNDLFNKKFSESGFISSFGL